MISLKPKAQQKDKPKEVNMIYFLIFLYFVKKTKQIAILKMAGNGLKL